MSDADDTPETGGWRTRIRSLRAASLAGIAFSVLIVIGLTLLRSQPSADATAAELEEYYLDDWNRSRVLLGLTASSFAAIAFLWFMAVIRRQVGEREDQFFSTVFLGSGLVFLSLFLTTAAASAAPALAIEFADAAVPSSGTVGLLKGYVWGLFSVVGVRMAAVFMLTTSTLGLRTHALPRWLGFLGVGLAVAMLVAATFSAPIGQLFALWVAVVSIELLVRRDKVEPATEPSG